MGRVEMNAMVSTDRQSRWRRRRARRISLCVFLWVAACGYPVTATAAQLTLPWTDNSFNETGFLILRKIAGTPRMSHIARVGENITTYTDTGIIPGVTYCYAIRAVDATGKSIRSNKACATAR